MTPLLASIFSIVQRPASDCMGIDQGGVHASLHQLIRQVTFATSYVKHSTLSCLCSGWKKLRHYPLGKNGVSLALYLVVWAMDMLLQVLPMVVLLHSSQHNLA
jgi:hypothetical protein